MDALFDIPAADGALFSADDLAYTPPVGERSNGVGQRSITFHTLQGTIDHGEVWSDGPIPDSWWVLTAEQRTVVVDVVTYTERAYTPPDPRPRP